MTTPTRGEIIEAQLARQWAERNKNYEVSSPEIQAAADFILANTTPPTMAEVEWDDDKHYLAEAHSISGLKVVMLHRVTDSQILCLGRGDVTHWTYYCNPEDLTPTGRKYELKEKNNDRTNP